MKDVHVRGLTGVRHVFMYCDILFKHAWCVFVKIRVRHVMSQLCFKCIREIVKIWKRSARRMVVPYLCKHVIDDGSD